MDQPGLKSAAFYKQLLVKYLAHVGSIEGVTFVSRIDVLADDEMGREGRLYFSEDEATELRRLDVESDGLCDPVLP